jgi:AraC family transcriptional regulator, arabinose operon regulatory protein
MFNLNINPNIRYVYSGYFRAPSNEWAHISRPLYEYELMIVTDGVLYIADDKYQYKVSAGEYILMPPTKHQYGHHPSYCSFYWLHFETPVNEINQTIQTETDYLLTFPLHGVCKNKNRIKTIAEQIAETERTYHDKIQSSYTLMNLLYELHKQSTSSSLDKINSNSEMCNAIMEYVQCNIMSKITVHEIAEYFGYHEKYLSTLFRNETGIPLKPYILKSKMDFACDLLIKTNETITQIGYNLGYPDVHNFSTAFHKYMSQTPGDYRKTHMM